MTLFTEAIEKVQAAARAWPVSVVSRETEATHDHPGHMETHMICREEVWRNERDPSKPLAREHCNQSVFRLIPISSDAAGAPVDQEWIIRPQVILDSIAAHIRQCHDPAIRM
jgi:hypothetical protein